MTKARRQFTRKFKVSVLNELETGKSLAQVARENMLRPSLISRWRREYYDDPENAFRGNGNLWKKDARINQLERLVGQLYAEKEFFKKALENMRKRYQEERKRTMVR